MDKKLYDLMDWAEIEAIVYSEHDHPETVLGMHKVRGGLLVQAFFPGAKSVFVKCRKDGRLYSMAEADEEGFFAALLPGHKIPSYEYMVDYGGGREAVYKDAYVYPTLIPEKELTLFKKGQNYEIYRYLGAHPAVVTGYGEEAELILEQEAQGKGKKGVKGVHFAVWAPGALRVSVVGDFNHWDGRTHQMCRNGDSGVFSLFVPELACGEIYKYEIKINSRTIVLKADPYAFRSEVRPQNASMVSNIFNFAWEDAEWLKKREEEDFREKAVAVYEVHLGSWCRLKQESDNLPEGFMNYRELAPSLAAYVKKMGYTHIELLPVMEHPLDESWGYQVTGYYAVTSRYGTPQDFMHFMNYMHKEGIGVILDWVPAHFPKDAHALAKFDGSCLYEYPDSRLGEHPHWGTLVFNYGCPQVVNFLIANALFWKDVYHADGIRVDAVASMLYLDYGRQDGEWLPNEYGGHENLQAIKLLQQLSTAFHKNADGAVLIAEESTAWPKVTGAVSENGLGFDMKWNMGWLNDFTSYMKQDPYFRKGSHGALIFSMIYAYSEQFLLPFSHDEVVHEKGSLLMKMPGDLPQKFGNLRVAFGFMMTHPGKKLHFMGQEFAQTAEWNEKRALHWEELSEPLHEAFQSYVKDLNHFYLYHAALYDNDYDEAGFEWISCMDAEHSIIAFMRKAKEKKEQLLVLCNFTPVRYENFKVGVPFDGKYKEIFNSDEEAYGGTGCVNRGTQQAKEVMWDGREYSITLNMPPFGVCIFQAVPGRR